jgi:lysophospholipase L1-like esterase
MRLVAVAALVLVTACTGPTPVADSPRAPDPSRSAWAGSPSPSTPRTVAPPLDTTRYVALGDSFTAGPLIPVTDLSSGCFRSDHNYPALLAERLEVEEFVDVSCSGASTRDLTGRQRTFAGAVLPPQVRAVDEHTTLVTVGIGGNDFGLYGRMVSTCLRVGDLDPTGAPCREAEGAAVEEEMPRIGRRVESAMARIQQRAAPDARVVLVGYPRIAPPEGACPRRLPYAAGDVAFADEVLRRLNGTLKRAAAAAGVEFVDLYAASRGHDVCSDKPWVNGQRTKQHDAAAFHPYLRGMRGAARAIEAHLLR